MGEAMPEKIWADGSASPMNGAFYGRPVTSATIYIRADIVGELRAALGDIRRIAADIPLIERNPRFAEASRAALAALARIDALKEK
ncbi:MAG: hypothetical protein ACK4NE_07855 [Albidovulum sp.]